MLANRLKSWNDGCMELCAGYRLSVLVSSVAALLLFMAGHTILAVVAIVNAVGCFWSWRVMHSYATELAKRGPDNTDVVYDITKRKAKGVPDWIAIVDILLSMAGLMLLITGMVVLV